MSAMITSYSQYEISERIAPTDSDALTIARTAAYSLADLFEQEYPTITFYVRETDDGATISGYGNCDTLTEIATRCHSDLWSDAIQVACDVLAIDTQ